MGGFSGFLGEEKMGKGFPEPGKLLGDICGHGWGYQDKHLRCNVSLLPEGGSRDSTGASLTEAWVACRANANVVAAWVVVVLQLVQSLFCFRF